MMQAWRDRFLREHPIDGFAVGPTGFAPTQQPYVVMVPVPVTPIFIADAATGPDNAADAATPTPHGQSNGSSSAAPGTWD